MIIESPVIRVGRSPEFLCDHLNDPANLEPLLPEEYVQAFTSEGDQCSFKVAGGFSVIIKRLEGPSSHHVHYVSQKGTPIRFKLDIEIEADQADSESATSTLQVRCDADLNPFMKMMAEKPLQSIFSGMAEAVQKAFPVDESV